MADNSSLGRRKGSFLNGKTVKRRKININNNNNNNSDEFEVNVNANVAAALRNALATLKRRKTVRFPNNVNNTTKRLSNFNKTWLPNLVNVGASNEQINIAKAEYQHLMRKEPNSPQLTAAATNAAHKFATFMQNINITYEPENAYNELVAVFDMIDTMPYTTATKKLMMRRAYKLLGYRMITNENNTNKSRVSLLLPEQRGLLRERMKIKAENWN